MILPLPNTKILIEWIPNVQPPSLPHFLNLSSRKIDWINNFSPSILLLFIHPHSVVSMTIPPLHIPSLWAAPHSSDNSPLWLSHCCSAPSNYSVRSSCSRACNNPPPHSGPRCPRLSLFPARNTAPPPGLSPQCDGECRAASTSPTTSGYPGCCCSRNYWNYSPRNAFPAASFHLSSSGRANCCQ